MKPDRQLIQEADRNFIGSFEKLVAHQPTGSVRWFGPIFGFVSHLEVSIFNGLVALEPCERAHVVAVADWLTSEAVRHTAWVREELGPAVSPALEAAGFDRLAWAQPVMGIRPPAGVPPPRTGVSVRTVEDEAGLEEHVRLVIASGMSEPTARRMYRPSFAFDPEVRLFTASLDGQPAGNAIAIRTGQTSGVYAVGTRPHARGRGVATAATWAAIDAGREWGCRLVVLQSSEMGLGVYTAMGFTVLDRLSMFRR